MIEENISLKQITIQSLNRNLSMLMAAPSSAAKPETHKEGLAEFYRIGGNCIHLHGEGGEIHSRRVTGEWLKEYNLRSEVFLCTQICHDEWDETTLQPIERFTPESIKNDIGTDLDLLGTYYLDLVYLDDRPHLPFKPILNAIFEEIGCGRVRNYAFRNWSADRIRAAHSYALSCSAPPPSAVVTTELSLLHSTQPLWPGYIPFDYELKNAVCELGLTVFAHAADYTLGQYVFEEIQTLSAIRPEWITRWEHPCNSMLIQKIQNFADDQQLTVREVFLAWLLNQSFPVVAIVGLPDFIAEHGLDYAKVSQIIHNDECVPTQAK